jgi:hypothetical protein
MIINIHTERDGECGSVAKPKPWATACFGNGDFNPNGVPASHQGRMAEALNSSGRPIAAGQWLRRGKKCPGEIGCARGQNFLTPACRIYGYIIFTKLPTEETTRWNNICFSWSFLKGTRWSRWYRSEIMQIPQHLFRSLGKVASLRAFGARAFCLLRIPSVTA